jgi:UDP-3-O-[3-hydroxymyristoyl] glucosamine N-acyltransferase
MPAFTLRELATHLGVELEGDASLLLRGVQGLDEAGPGELSFLANTRYRERLPHTRAGAVLLRPEDRPLCPASTACLISPEPYLAFARAMQLFHPPALPEGWGVHASCVIAPGARIHPETWLGPGVVVEEDVEIGAGSRLLGRTTLHRGVRLGRDCLVHSGCTLREHSVLGDRVLLQNGVVVGSEGFGFAPLPEGGSLKIPQAGRVVIEDDVEVGANTCLDRGTMGDTIIRRGARLDNLIQIAHNVEVGPGTLMAAQCGVAGSTRIGANCRIGGASAITGHAVVGDRVQIGGGSGVTGSVPDDRIYAGFPARPHREFLQQQAALARLPRLQEQVRQLEQALNAALERLHALEATLDPSTTPDEEDPA